MDAKLAFQNDKYKKIRGGYSRWLSLRCEACDARLMTYQKDGPGVLKRLYLDRIVSADGLADGQDLVCGKCRTVLGIRTVYQKEKRPAYRLFAGAVLKKIVGGAEAARTTQAP